MSCKSGEIQNIVREGWLKSHRIYTQNSVLTLDFRALRPVTLRAQTPPETRAVLDGLERAVKDYPEGVPQDIADESQRSAWRYSQAGR